MVTTNNKYLIKIADMTNPFSGISSTVASGLRGITSSLPKPPPPPPPTATIGIRG